MAKKYESANEGWDNDKSHITPLPKDMPDDPDKYIGRYMVGTFAVVFRLNFQPAAEKRDYRWRGVMGIQGANGYYLEMKGDLYNAMKAHWDEKEAKLREAYPDGIPEKKWKDFQRKSNEAMKATMLLHSNAESEEEIKHYIAQCGVELCQKHWEAIRDQQYKSGKRAGVTMLAAWDLVGESFMLEYATRSKRYQDEIRRSIQGVALQLSGHLMHMVTPVMVRQCMSDLGNDEKVKQRFRRAEQFWDYCIGNQLADGKNPITDLLKGGKHKAVNAAAAERSISKQVMLKDEEEQRLNEYLEANWQKPLGRALLLCKEAALNPGELAGLQVRHLMICEKPLRVHVRRVRFYAGSATQDYTVPLSPFCARLMKRWYDDLVEQNPDADLSDIYVCGAGNEPTARDAIDLYIRRMLMALNIPGDNPDKRTYGWNLLRDNLEHRLVTYCGLQATSGAVKFLLGRSLASDTTSDHYHSFADPSGQEMLYRALARDRRFFCEPMPRLSSEGVYPALDPRKRNLLEIEVAVKADSTLDLSCLHGISGTLSVLEP